MNFILIRHKKAAPRPCKACGDLFTPTRSNRKTQIMCAKPECKRQLVMNLKKRRAT